MPEEDLPEGAEPDEGEAEDGELSTARLLDIPPETAAKVDKEMGKPRRPLWGLLSWFQRGD